MNKYVYKCFLSIILLCCVFLQALPANAYWLNNLEHKTGSEAARMLKKAHWKFYCSHREAKSPQDFDKLSNVKIKRSNLSVSAECYSRYRVKNYVDRRRGKKTTVDQVLKEFEGSPFQVKINYRITTSPYMNGVVVSQRPKPGYVFKSDAIKYTTEKKSFNPFRNLFKKPVLNRGYSGAYPRNRSQQPSRPVEKVIRLTAYKMKAVVMPDLKGLTYDEAISEINKKNVPIIYTQRLEEETKDFNKHNKVFLQTTKPGTIVDKNIMLGLKVYSYKGKPKVPDVFNKNKEEAVKLIKKANLTPKIKYIDITKEYANAISHFIPLAGRVKEQDKKAGTQLQSGEQVKITVYSLPETRMPDIAGLEYKDGLKKMFKKIKPEIKKYEIKYINVPAKEGKEKDKIITKTEPAAGQKVKTGDLIKVYRQRTVPLMPDVIGMTEEEAEKELKKFGLEVKYRGAHPNPKFKTGQVYAIHPEVGREIKPDKDISLTITDNDSITLPYVWRKTPEEAIKSLKESGYNNYVVEYVYADKNAKLAKLTYKDSIGEVTRVEPNKQGQIVPTDTKIHLKVLKWLEDKPVEVPFLTGMTEESAVWRLKDKGLIPNITYSTTNLADYNGKVLGGQIPKPYTEVKRGTVVSFTVVGHRVNVPVVTHLTEKEAVAELKKVGLKSKITYENTDIKSRQGNVKEQKPAFREKVKSGSTVELVVYKYSNMVTVPNLINHELNEGIKSYLKEKNLKYTVKYVDTVLTSQVNDTIFKTEPAYKTKVKEGSDITVYIHKELDEVPDVMGKTEAEAVNTLKNLDFGVKKIYVSDAKPGIVSLQTQRPGSEPTHAAITLTIGKTNSAEQENKIKQIYKDLKQAYEYKEEYQITNLLTNDWESDDGSTVLDVEDNLRNKFTIYDTIQCNITDLNITKTGNNKFKASYNIEIIGKSYETGISRKEKSSVSEEVIFENENPKINRTLNGRFWYRE